MRPIFICYSEKRFLRQHLRQHHFEAVGFVVRREDLDDCHLGGERRGEDHVLVAADHVVFRHRAGEIVNPYPLDWQGRRVHHMDLVAGGGQEQAAFIQAFGGRRNRPLSSRLSVADSASVSKRVWVPQPL